MAYILVFALVIAMGFVVYAVVRGLKAFASMDPNDVDEHGVPRALAMQNKMMFSRVKWQAVAIAIVALLLALASAGN